MSIRTKLIAYTTVVDTIEEYEVAEGDFPSDAEKLVEMAGRLCYESWHRPNSSTATAATYVENIKRLKHFSVLEHGTATIYISGCSRNCTHELVRHRHFSFSQLSQRYVDGRQSRIAGHPDFGGLSRTITDMVFDLNQQARDLYGIMVDELEKKGLSHKEARQAARQVLPGGTETKIMVTGNHRSWREFIEKRLSPHADKEIREVAEQILRLLYPIAPSIYSDLVDTLLGV